MHMMMTTKRELVIIMRIGKVVIVNQKFGLHTIGIPVSGKKLNIDIDVFVSPGYASRANWKVRYKTTNSDNWINVWSQNNYYAGNRHRKKWNLDLNGQEVTTVQIWTHDIGQGSPRFRVYDVGVGYYDYCPPTQTATPIECCEDYRYTQQTLGGTDTNPIQDGVSIRGFEIGGTICHHAVIEDGQENSFGVPVNKKDGMTSFGRISAIGKFTNNEITYLW